MYNWKRQYYSLMLLFFTVLGTSNAQTLEELQQQERVTWIGTADYLYALDTVKDSYYNYTNDPKGRDNGLKTLKFQQSKGLYLNYYPKAEIYFTLINGIRDNKITVYKSPKLEKFYAKEEVKKRFVRIDTVLNLDLWCFDDCESYVINEADPYHYSSFIINQLIYYNAENQMLYALPQTLGIRESIYDDNGNLKGERDDLWLPIRVEQAPLDYINNRNISWAKRTYHYSNIMLKKPLEIEVSKGNYTWEAIIAHTFEKNNEKVNKNGLIQPQSIDPVGTVLKKKSLATHILGKKAVGLEFIHDWYWDSEKGSFSVYYVGFAILGEAVINGKPEVLYFRRNE